MNSKKIKTILLVDIEESKQHFNYAHHPLGLMYLSAYIEYIFPAIVVHIFHTITHESPIDRYAELVSNLSPDLIGFRSCSKYAQQFKEFAHFTKTKYPNMILLAGGPYPSICYESLLIDGIVDLVVLGEGEQVFVDIIKYINFNGILPESIPGIAIRKNNHICHSSSPRFLEDLDQLPFPDYTKINFQNYEGYCNQSNIPLNRYALIKTSRGCPFQCIYCHNLFGKKIRRNSPEYVISMFETYIQKYDIHDFVIIDDVFNIPLQYGKELLKKISQRFSGIRLYFANCLRADYMDKEFVDLLEQAGTVMVAVAIESASNRLQHYIRKNLNLQKAAQNIHLLSVKFVTRLFLMIGFPTETYDEAKHTIDWSSQFDLVLPALFTVRVYPNTEIHSRLSPSPSQNEQLEKQSTFFYDARFNRDGYFYGDVFSRDLVPLTSQDIYQLRVYWAKKIFLNPTRILKFNHILRKYLNEENIRLFYKQIYGYINPNPDISFDIFQKYFLLKKNNTIKKTSQ